MKSLITALLVAQISCAAYAAPPQQQPPSEPQPRSCPDASLAVTSLNKKFDWNGMGMAPRHSGNFIDTKPTIEEIAAKCHPGDLITLPRGTLVMHLCDPAKPINRINGDVTCTFALQP